MTIAKHRKLKGLSQGNLAEELKKFGLNPSTASISAWEKNVSLPNAYQFLCLCSVLGITDIYSEFISEEGSVLSGLNDEGKKRAREYISLLKSSSEFISGGAVIPLQEVKKKQTVQKKQKVEKTYVPSRIIRLYDLPASAGIGEFLDGDMFEEVEADSTVPVNASFGIRVSGDSMEPVYHDRDLVFVERLHKSGGDTLQPGETGAFISGNECYLKIYREDGLYSFNPSYAPMHFSGSDSVYLIGRVLGTVRKEDIARKEDREGDYG